MAGRKEDLAECALAERDRPLNPSLILREAAAQGRRVLNEWDSKLLIGARGIAIPRGALVRTNSDPRIDGLTAPLAAKLISPDLVHKSDAGGVRLNLVDQRSIRATVDDLLLLADRHRMRADGVLLEEMAPAGIELVVGGAIDPRFGPVVMLGMGGIFVEVFGDCAFAVCPITSADAQDMIDRLRGVALLRGVRGRKPVDEASIVGALLAVGGETGLLVEMEDQIREIDINPLIVSEHAAIACDARMVLAPGEVANA